MYKYILTSANFRKALTLIVNLAASVTLAGIAGRNPAAHALSLVFIGIAAAFSGVLGIPPGWVPLGFQKYWLGIIRLPGDLALLVGVWSFVAHFPRVEVGSAVQRTASTLTRVALLVGMLLFFIHLWLELNGHRPPSLVATLDRHVPNTLYWSVVFPLIALAAPFGARKLQLGYVGARQQVRVFLFGLFLGLGPIALLSAVGSASTTAARLLRSDHVFPIATLLVFIGLWTLPVTTAVAVIVSDVLPLRFVVRRSLQYSLTRQGLSVAIILPILGAVVILAANPSQTIGEFLADGGWAWLLAAALGVFAAMGRGYLLALIDRAFLRRPIDARSLIAQVGIASRRKLSARDAGEALLLAVRTAFHPQAAAVLVATPSGDFASLVGRSQPIPVTSALARVLEASHEALTLNGPSDDLARLLPVSDRAWAVENKWQVLAPLLAEGEVLIGILCVGVRTSADSFSIDDLATIEALCSASAPQIARRVGGLAPSSATELIGTECERCGELFDHLATNCACGRPLVGSVLPRRVAARFTLRRRLGRGGMGIVYRATDDALGREVVLKTLPEVGPLESIQLRTEARTMASLQHPGLAFVLGLEVVGPLPVLVVEFLAGGTLADILRRGPLRASDVIDLGIRLADALEYLHGMGVLHRDLKPSNVGLTATGQPKLLDFGVAVHLALAPESGAAGTMLYMPPEALSGTASSPMFDLWSLGVLLCEMWLGRHPLAYLPPERQRHIVETGDIWRHAVDALQSPSPSLASVLSTALSREQPRRFANANTFRTALERCRQRE